MLIPIMVLSQALGIDPAPLIPAMPPPNSDDLGKFFDSLGNLRGASAMVVAVFCVQVVIAFLKSKLGEFAGKYQYLTVYGLTLISGILSLKSVGLDWAAAALHANSLAAAQVFLHQGFTLFIKARDPSLLLK